MPLVGEPDRRFKQLALGLYVHLVIAIDHDVGDLRVPEKGLDRAEAHDLVLDRLDHVAALLRIQRCIHVGQVASADIADLPARVVQLQRADQRQIDDLEQVLVNPVFPLALDVAQRLEDVVDLRRGGFARLQPRLGFVSRNSGGRLLLETKGHGSAPE